MNSAPFGLAVLLFSGCAGPSTSRPSRILYNDPEFEVRVTDLEAVPDASSVTFQLRSKSPFHSASDALIRGATVLVFCDIDGDGFYDVNEPRRLRRLTTPIPTMNVTQTVDIPEQRPLLVDMQVLLTRGWRNLPTRVLADDMPNFATEPVSVQELP